MSVYITIKSVRKVIVYLNTLPNYTSSVVQDEKLVFVYFVTKLVFSFSKTPHFLLPVANMVLILRPQLDPWRSTGLLDVTTSSDHTVASAKIAASCDRVITSFVNEIYARTAKVPVQSDRSNFSMVDTRAIIMA